MITGVHAIMFAQDADAVRAFLRDTLELDSVDAGGGWLIFALPPAELAARRLLERIASPDRPGVEQLVVPRLVVRASSARPVPRAGG